MLSKLYQNAKSPSDFYRILGYGSERHARCVWSQRYKSKGVSAWQYIGSRSKNGATTSISAYSQQTSANSKNGYEYSVDVCVSPNQFYNWRNTKQLVLFCANWVEIDVAKKGLSQLEEMAVIDDVLSQLAAHGIPPPSACNASGSGGWHLYWIYDPIEAYHWRKPVWKAISKKLTDKLVGNGIWHVDPTATHDPARVLKVPGTLNSKTGRRVVSWVGGPTYTFNELAQSLAVNDEKPEYLTAIPSKMDKPAVTQKTQTALKEKRRVTGRHNIKHWWQRTAWAVESHSRRVGVKEGARDKTAFILYVAYCHTHGDPEAAMNEIKIKNAAFIGLSETELSAYLKTAKKAQYKYRKDTLAVYLENLCIDPAFLYETGITAPLPPEKIKAAQQDAAKSTATKKRTKTEEAIKAALLRLHRAGNTKPTQADIAQETGLSLSTIKRNSALLREHISLGVISSPSIYTPFL